MITLNTIIWEGNFDQVLDENSYFLNINSPLIKEKNLIVNNISSKDRFYNKLEAARKKHNINFYLVEENINEALSFFNIDINENTLGYYYTAPYFVAFLKSKEPYLLNISSDCVVSMEDDYLTDSIDELSKNEDAIATTLPWRANRDVGSPEQEKMFRIYGREFPLLEKFHYCSGFSDQVFLTELERMKKVDFNTSHDGTNHFPIYGGNSFEKRLCSYFLNNQKYRLVYKNHHYIHDNHTE